MACLATSTGSFLAPHCWASDSGLQNLPATPTEWVPAPKQVNLDKVVRLRIPDGYKFASESGARSFLQDANTPAPAGLIGVLAPTSRGPYVVLAYQQTGFINSPKAVTLPADTLLARIQKEVPTRTLTWDIAPSYNSEENYLESALRLTDATPAKVYHTIHWLTRNGVLTATAIYPKGASSPVIALKLALTSDSFRDGERYHDHQITDRAAKTGLDSLVVQNATSEFTTASSGDSTGSSRNPVLIGSVVGVLFCGLAGGGLVALRRYRQRSIAPAPLMVAEQHVPTRSTIISSHLETNGHTAQHNSKPKLETSLSGLKRNGAKAGNNQLVNGDQRKRMFDYNRYFSDLMNAVSSSVHLEPSNINGHTLDANSINGDVDLAHAAAANLEVLNHQKLLIEEQKRLITEQSRLIEEKSQLIAEKNRLLKMQAEWMENKLM
jgi:hypothetical protein